MVATLAVPAAASASVNVDDNGAGTVGKGDVQTALSLKNDAAMQDLFKKDGIKFESTFKTVKDTSWSCTDGTVKHHYFNTDEHQPAERRCADQRRRQAQQRLDSRRRHQRLRPHDRLHHRRRWNRSIRDVLLRRSRLHDLLHHERGAVALGRRSPGQRHRPAEHPGRGRAGRLGPTATAVQRAVSREGRPLFLFACSGIHALRKHAEPPVLASREITQVVQRVSSCQTRGCG